VVLFRLLFPWYNIYRYVKISLFLLSAYLKSKVNVYSKNIDICQHFFFKYIPCPVPFFHNHISLLEQNYYIRVGRQGNSRPQRPSVDELIGFVSDQIIRMRVQVSVNFWNLILLEYNRKRIKTAISDDFLTI